MGGGGVCTLVGKDNGSVDVYESIRGELQQVLFARRTAIRFLDYNDEAGIIVCADQSGRLVCYRLMMHRRAQWGVETVFEVHMAASIIQVLPNAGLTRLLACTRDECLLYSVGPSQNRGTAIATFPWSDHRPRSPWVQHPTEPELLLLISNGRAHTFLWDSLQLMGCSGEVASMEQTLAERITGCVYRPSCRRLGLFTPRRFQAAGYSPPSAKTCDQVYNIAPRYTCGLSTGSARPAPAL